MSEYGPRPPGPPPRCSTYSHSLIAVTVRPRTRTAPPAPARMTWNTPSGRLPAILPGGTSETRSMRGATS